MNIAAKELRDWVEGKQPETPLLDVSYCQKSSAERIVHLRPVQPPPSAGAMAFEGDVADVVVGKPPAASGKPSCLKTKPTEEGKFVYSTAALLVRQDKYSWPKALETARELWKNMPKGGRGKRKPAQIQYEPDVIDDSDHEPLDLVDR